MNNTSTDFATTADASSPEFPPLKIGPLVVDPPVLQAPMAGFTNYAFRQIAREFGGIGLMATEMIHARGFLWQDRQRHELPQRLWGVADEARPLAVQIWDNDPAALAAVGHKLASELGVSVVDINFGCPVRQVTEKAQSGSYLLQYPDRMQQIIEGVVAACAPTPVTAKIRLGCTRDQINAIEVAQVVEAAGAAALTVHGRTAQDYFRGSADWDQISQIKPYLQKIPLIGNGDLDSAEKVVHTLRTYDVDGVMIARASLGRPWIFSQVAAALRGERVPDDPSLDDQRQLVLRHYELIRKRFGDRRGTVLMRKYACCYAQGRPGARGFRSRVANVDTPEEFVSAVEETFPRETPTD